MEPTDRGVHRERSEGKPPSSTRRPELGEPQGGDPACWAGLLCPDCGAVLDGGPHKAGCQR